MNIKHLTVAVGSLMLLSSTALAQGLSAYKDPSSGNVWITGLQPKTEYEIKNVLRNGRRSSIQKKTNTCGQAGVPDGATKYQSLTVEGKTFIVSNLPSKEHERCNPSRPNPNG
jgi:hypothetical protein